MGEGEDDGERDDGSMGGVQEAHDDVEVGQANCFAEPD